MRRPTFCYCVLTVTLFAACAGEEPHPPPAAPTAPAPQAAPATPPASAPAAQDAFAPLTSRDRESAAGERIDAPGAFFTLPSGWQREPPSSSMRLAQAILPGEAGPGQLTVFYFGEGGGGGVESNLERWASQVEPDPGEQPIRDSFDVGQFKVHWMEIAGTLLPSTMGTGPTEPQPGSRLLGAVVEGPGGPWFFKVTGPAATVAAERNAFIDMLKSVEASSV